MSFAKQVKNELAQRDFGKLKKELSCGLVYFSKNFSEKSISLQTETESVANLYKNLIDAYTKVKLEISVNGEKKPLYTVVSTQEKNNEKIYKYYSGIIDKIFFDIKKNKNKSASVAPFLTGAFLAYGNISNPKKSYYLDFTLNSQDHANIITNLLKLISINSKVMVRKTGDYVVYIKDSESIEDLLTYLGATKSTLEIMEVKIYKEIRNFENRKNNFEIANIEKTAIASAQQIFDIEYILEKKGWDYLDDEMKHIAKRRIENPDLSLSDLCKLIEPPLTRSSLNRRLKKFEILADNLRNKKDKEVV